LLKYKLFPYTTLFRSICKFKKWGVFIIMNWKKWSLLLGIVFAMSMFLAASGGVDDAESNGDANESGEADGEEELADEQELSVNIKTEPPSLHSGTSTDTTSSAVLDQVFEGLTRVNQEGEVEEGMAES